MRVSCRKDDPGYAKWFNGGQYLGWRCWIDGIERKWVITADEEQRMALCAVLDEQGRSMLDRAKREIKTEWVYGTVLVEMSRPDGQPASAPIAQTTPHRVFPAGPLALY